MNTLWHILQTTDSAFPVGGFSHSYGLEGLVQDGVITNKDDLAAFTEQSWIHMMSRLELPLVRLAHNASTREAWFDLDQLAWACRTTKESRQAQRQMGLQRLKLVSGISQDSMLTELYALAEQGQWHSQWPIVAGIESRLLSVPLEDALVAFCYQSMNGILAASAKLIPIGPTDIQRLLRRAMLLSESAIPSSLLVKRDDIGWFTPLLDVTGARHETAYTRIFIS